MSDLAKGFAQGAGGCLGFVAAGATLLIAALVWAQWSEGERWAKGRVDASDAQVYCGTALILLRQNGYDALELAGAAVRRTNPEARFTCAARRLRDGRALTVVAERFCGAAPHECTGVVEIRDVETREVIWTR
ncbi:MAG: hypothetical protein K2X34_13500 [Hyphomonadaceae bacterium]|nr:hypothetical protein [Hyphomonadaceae bacterium]